MDAETAVQSPMSARSERPAEPPALPRLELEGLATGALPLEELLHREWLVPNGLGGYSMGSVGLCPTRRYHSLFTPNVGHLGRTVLLARLGEEVEVEGAWYRLDAEEHPERGVEGGVAEGHLERFGLTGLLPEWTLGAGGARLTRSLTWQHGHNVLGLLYTHRGGPPVRLRLRPWTVCRPHDRPLHHEVYEAAVSFAPGRMSVRYDEAHLVMELVAPGQAVQAPQVSEPLHLRVEKARGYDFRERQASPGHFELELKPGQSVGLYVTARTPEASAALPAEPTAAVVRLFEEERERQRQLLAQAPALAREGAAAHLVLATDAYIMAPRTRRDDPEARSVIAGYPWFTDWGRDTMISLEGLTLCTGRPHTAAKILRTFKSAVKDGLLPNLYPEGGEEGLYHTADATLWFFHAVERYVQSTGDVALLAEFFPTFQDIVAHHQRGTRFHIHVDPRDGLLHQGAPGYQLTWMDAKVEGWVVTPRRGKAVEINALWFNALSLMAKWAERLGKDARPYRAEAERVEASFNARFWNPATGCLYDVVDGEGGDDAAVRPNQVFAIALPHPVLRRERWEAVMQVVDRELRTPVGLRSLSPHHPDFKANYDGDLRARDAAYHQGTVWSWLIGPYVDAHLKVANDPAETEARLQTLFAHLNDSGLGHVSEIFDATPPYRSRGCPAQAWGVAELLRVLLKLEALRGRTRPTA